jgi:hypothetical protein
MDLRPWSERQLQIRLKNKKAGTEARSKADLSRVADTHPSHPLAVYAGAYENPAYGVMNIGLKDNQLQFDFHKMRLPMWEDRDRTGAGRQAVARPARHR